MMGYGSEAPQKAERGHFPVPPPPDGKPPVRLPIGAPAQTPPTPQEPQSGDEDLVRQIMQMLQQTERG